MHLMNCEKMLNFRSHRPWVLIAYVLIMFTNSIFSFIDVPIKHIWRYDKFIHFGEYFILGVLLFYTLYENFISKENLIYSILAVSLIPVLDESIQYFTPNRIPSIYDAFADYLGCYSGCFIYHIINRHYNG